MIERPSIELERRDARQFLAAALARRLGYTPEWLAADKSPGAALAAITSRYLEAVAQRLAQAPDKNKLAFLDLAGLGLVAAQAARAPIVFRLAEQSAGGSAPARTPVAAPPPPGSKQQIMFETEQAVGVTAGRLKQLFSLWPGRDEYIDHSAAFAAGLPVQPFAAALRQPTPHHLYLAHPVLLALAGNVELAVEFEVTRPSSKALEILWEYWDGEVWRGFLSTTPQCNAQAEDFDSTDGLKQSGSYLLKADAAQAAKSTVNGAENYWLRGRLIGTLPPDAGVSLPEVDSVRVASTVNRAFRGRVRVSEPRLHDAKQVNPSGVPNAIALGGKVTNEAGQPVEGAVVHLFVPGKPGPAFTSAPTAPDGLYTILNVNFAVEYRYDVAFAGIRFWGSDAATKPKERASAAKAAIDIAIAIEGLEPDKAFADGTALDVTKPFYPLGQQPQPGSAFYFSNEEAFTKPGAQVKIFLARTLSPQDEGGLTGSPQPLSHQLEWEYWNNRQWAPLAVTSNFANSKLDLNRTEVIAFTVPLDMLPVAVNGQVAKWVRARLQSGTYGFKQEVAFNTGATAFTTGGAAPSRFTYLVTQPPVLAAFRIAYTWQYGLFHPERVITYNDFQYRDQTEAAIWPGTTFRPFERVADTTPALYLGFDRKPPIEQLGVFFDLQEMWGEPAGPALAWEYWDGFAWRRLPADDETGNLRRPGIVNLLARADDTALARFGLALHWIRARLKEDGPPGEPVIAGLFPNAVWASERRTLRDLPVGTSTATPNQVFALTQAPILPGELIEVRELSGARANVEWRILTMEIFDGNDVVLRDLEELLGREGTDPDVTRGPLRLRRNRQKQVTEVWVRWESREHLFFSAGDRHYALDRATGRLRFGDGANGRVPPASAAILIREMSTGGGGLGNVPTRSITQLLGVVPGIEAVFNPRPAEGGADGETSRAALLRGPRTIRHRGRAMDAADYETLAIQASPAVAVARALPGRNPSGVRQPGWVTLLIIPRSQDLRPYPSFGLREHIRRFLEDRAPADLAALHRIQVTGPVYLPVDVSASIAAGDPSQSGAVEKAAREALERFLHPLTGGPRGQGWDLGRDVFLSDIAAVLERTDGLDYVEELTLLRDGVPQGESLSVDEHQIVAAGAITLKLRETGS